MPEVLEDLVHLGVGSHALSLHASRDEAAAHAVDFLAGTPVGQSAAYWVPDDDIAEEYYDRLVMQAPALAGCVFVLPHSQAVPQDGHRRPAPEIAEVIGQHPEGMTAAGETISRFWTPDTVPEYLEYEAWFDTQPRSESRFLCPYDLRTVPAEDAPRVLRELGAHHTHVLLSEGEHPAVQLLQLFLFATPSDVPPALQGVLRWAVAERLVVAPGPGQPMDLTPLGQTLVQRWSLEATIDW